MPAGNGIDLLEALGRIAISWQAAPTGVPGRIWDELRPWIAKLALHAAPKWLPRLSFGFPCHVATIVPDGPPIACVGAAVAACDVCAQPCCLDHARIDQYGDAICYVCIVRARHWHQQYLQAQQRMPPRRPPPPEEEIRWARTQLGVKQGATWEEIRVAHRKQSAKHHPDKQRTPEAKAKAEARFKEIQRALDVLDRVRQQQQQETTAS
jgi:hypothetical protein